MDSKSSQTPIGNYIMDVRDTGKSINTFSSKFSTFVDNVADLSSLENSTRLVDRWNHKIQLYSKKSSAADRTIEYWFNFDNVLSRRQVKKVSIELKATQFYNVLRNHTFEMGMISQGDIYLSKLYGEISEDVCNNILHKVWAKCFGGRVDDATAHFLHCLTKIGSYSDTDYFVAIPISATRHVDIEIKEAGLAIFDSWADPKYLSVLEKVEDTGILWLDEYKHSIIEDLK